MVRVAWVAGEFTRVPRGRTLASETKGCHELARDLDVGSGKRRQAAGEKAHRTHRCVNGTVMKRLGSEEFVWLIGLGLVILLRYCWATKYTLSLSPAMDNPLLPLSFLPVQLFPPLFEFRPL